MPFPLKSHCIYVELVLRNLSLGGNLKKFLIVAILSIPLLLIAVFYSSEKVRNFCYFTGWHYGFISVPNLSEVISRQPESLLTINIKSPDEKSTESLIKMIQYLKKLKESVSLIDSKVEDQFANLGINREKRIIASSPSNISFEKVLEKFNKLGAFKNFEMTIGIGVTDEAMKKIETASKDPGKFAADAVFGTILIKLPQKIPSGSPLAMIAKDPKILLDKVVSNLYLEADIVKKITDIKSDLNFTVDYSLGIPAYKMSYAKNPSKESYITVLGRDHLLITSDINSFKKFFSDLQVSAPSSHQRTKEEVLWARLNLEKIVVGLPEKTKVFLPSSLRNLKFLTLQNSLSNNFNFSINVDFKDDSSAKEALLQLNMAKGLLNSKKPKDAKLQETADNWIKKYFTLNVQGASLIAKLDIPLAEPHAQIERYLKLQYTQLSQDFTALGAAIQYMKSNKLVQIKLKDLKDPSIFGESGWSGIRPFHISSGATLSAIHNGTSFRPLMLVTQANCQDESKFDFEFKNVSKSTSVSMYKLYQDAKALNQKISFDSKSTGVHVFVLTGADFSNDWQLVFHSPADSQLEAIKVNEVNNNFMGNPAEKTMVKFKSNSNCQIPYEPFVLAQLAP